MIDTKNFQPLNLEETGNKKHGGRKGVLTLICSKKNGKRLMISKELAETLGLTDTVKIGFIGNKLVLGKHLPGDSNEFSLKKQGKKLVVYSAEVVQKIVKTLDLEFNGKVSKTWYKPLLDEHDNSPVAILEAEGGDNYGE
ncbi:hypothetical protein [Massilistercora timonensis]|uniref:hypothetical protein n=1 Tax=Massilistercora timonensis TaxID=2086584 RepID=UPI003AB7014C